MKGDIFMKTKNVSSVRRKNGLRVIKNSSHRKNIFSTDAWKKYDYQKAMEDNPEIAAPQLLFPKKEC